MMYDRRVHVIKKEDFKNIIIYIGLSVEYGIKNGIISINPENPLDNTVFISRSNIRKISTIFQNTIQERKFKLGNKYKVPVYKTIKDGVVTHYMYMLLQDRKELEKTGLKYNSFEEMLKVIVDFTSIAKDNGFIMV